MLLRNLALVLIPALAVAFWAARRTLTARTVVMGLLLGMASALIALLAGLLFPPGLIGLRGLAAALLRSFLLVAAVEELSRLIVLPLLLRRREETRRTQRPRQYALRAGVVVGIGFAVLESLTLIGRAGSVLALRAVTALPVHAFGGAALGLAFGMSSADDNGPAVTLGPAVLVAVLVATGVHGSYDLLLRLGARYQTWSLAVVAAAVSAVLAGDHLSARADGGSSRQRGRPGLDG